MDITELTNEQRLEFNRVLLFGFPLSDLIAAALVGTGWVESDPTTGKFHFSEAAIEAWRSLKAEDKYISKEGVILHSPWAKYCTPPPPPVFTPEQERRVREILTEVIREAFHV